MTNESVKDSKKHPTSFQLGGNPWTIELDNKTLDLEGNYGTCDHITSKIKYQTETKGEQRTECSVNQTIYHEVVHAILDSMGEHELSCNEKFVQQFSMYMHQFEKSKK